MTVFYVTEGKAGKMSVQIFDTLETNYLICVKKDFSSFNN
jgi:hypothetical protein